MPDHIPPSFFVDVVTRSVDNPDEPPRRDRINYASERARIWLAKHSMWALNTGHSVLTAPAE